MKMTPSWLLVVVNISLVSITYQKEIRQLTKANIAPGSGYSKDSQQIAPQICFNTATTTTSGSQSSIRLDTALSYSELEKELGVSVSIGGSYKLFSAEAQTSYLRSVKDTDYSLSLNYYQFISNEVDVQIAGFGLDALTETGKSFYNDGKNAFFGLLCGDQYIANYQQGALLLMTLNIKFSSVYMKEKFEEKVSASFANIFSASTSVQSSTSKYGITGSVIIQSYQIGGDPDKLSNILGEDGAGNFPALTCSLTSMSSCTSAASDMLNYARSDFQSQISLSGNKGLAPLGLGFAQFLPIEYVGLIPPPSLVTAEVEQYRNELESVLKENEYYQEKLYSLLNQGYPVTLSSSFLTQARGILSRAIANIAVLMQAHNGGADCYSYPDQCKIIKEKIDSQLDNIPASDLAFLEYIKYTITAHINYNNHGGTSIVVYEFTLHNTGDSGRSWIPLAPEDYPRKTWIKSYSAEVSGTSLHYDIMFGNENEHYDQITYSGTLKTTTGNDYVGTLYWTWTKDAPVLVSTTWIETRVPSPFYFTKASF